ncbi:MAG: sulfotransferase domain-containing protein [Myxococcota bacterium]
MADRFSAIGRRIVLATHRRSGTHLTLDLLRRQFADCASTKRVGESLAELYLNLERLVDARRPISQERALALLGRAPRPIVKTHALPDFAPWQPDHAEFVRELLADADVYNVHRDGRDVLASLHLYQRAFDPAARVPVSEFLRQKHEGMSRPAFWAHHVLRWRDTPGVRTLAYHEIVGDPRGTVARLARELALEPLLREPLLPRRLSSVWEARWLRLARRPEVTTVLGDRRGARPVPWRESFSAEDRAFFAGEAGHALVALGYEDDDGWVDG